jgi:hypothetical protein
MNPEALISFVQDQFGRIDRWCWETIIEEVAEYRQIALNPDNMTYAGGSMRVGPYQLGVTTGLTSPSVPDFAIKPLVFLHDMEVPEGVPLAVEVSGS